MSYKRRYILRNDRPDILDRITGELAVLYRDSGEYDVTIAPHVERRSLDQNAYLWGVVNRDIAAETGYTKNEVHVLLLQKFAPRVGFTDLDGNPAERIITTREMKKKQMSAYLDAVLQWAAENGFVIADPVTTDFWTEVA